MMKTREKLFEFMQGYLHGVISTVDENGAPCSAIVGFGQTRDLEIVIGTTNTSQKYQNLMADSRVAFVLGGATLETIQFQGTARELRPDELDIVRQNYWTKNPRVEKYHEDPAERYFLLKPTWIRYSNVGVDPWDITELKF